ncbi:TPA: BPSL0067 family protein [Salmonella enterica]
MFGNKTIDAWTVFAIFVNGRYPDHNSGNPAAFYLGQDVGGIGMMNQWKDDIAKLRTSKRYMRKLCNGGLHSEGAYIRMNNNAATYYIVE